MSGNVLCLVCAWPKACQQSTHTYVLTCQKGELRWYLVWVDFTFNNLMKEGCVKGSFSSKVHHYKNIQDLYWIFHFVCLCIKEIVYILLRNYDILRYGITLFLENIIYLKDFLICKKWADSENLKYLRPKLELKCIIRGEIF